MAYSERADIPAQVYALQGLSKVAEYALASPPPRLEDADAAGVSTVPAGPWAGGAGQSALSPACAAGREPRQVEYWKCFAGLRPHRLLEPGSMPLHQQLQERLASNCRGTRHDAEGGLPPSMRWLQELGPAVADSGGLTVGGLRAALGSADPSVQRVVEKVRACATVCWSRAGVAGSHADQLSTCRHLLG